MKVIVKKFVTVEYIDNDKKARKISLPFDLAQTFGAERRKTTTASAPQTLSKILKMLQTG